LQTNNELRAVARRKLTKTFAYPLELRKKRTEKERKFVAACVFSRVRIFQLYPQRLPETTL
jgi:hypothetical protein